MKKRGKKGNIVRSERCDFDVMKREGEKVGKFASMRMFTLSPRPLVFTTRSYSVV